MNDRDWEPTPNASHPMWVLDRHGRYCGECRNQADADSTVRRLLASSPMHAPYEIVSAFEEAHK